MIPPCNYAQHAAEGGFLLHCCLSMIPPCNYASASSQRRDAWRRLPFYFLLLMLPGAAARARRAKTPSAAPLLPLPGAPPLSFPVAPCPAESSSTPSSPPPRRPRGPPRRRRRRSRRPPCRAPWARPRHRRRSPRRLAMQRLLRRPAGIVHAPLSLTLPLGGVYTGAESGIYFFHY
ncbi:hypothetical protein PVAP13_2KG540930 [Panicum virgatum]|uniref:Uncharacterized protein n=1 Tax=Panicum virgatum TaxID=38727 RepID=A0A8T0WQM4_PANVG|nr:hypothetical protein PVAP13_2KG540930 [Panicum virgatum]